MSIKEKVSAQVHESPIWSRSTKVIVTVSALLLIAIVAYRFESLLQQLIIAAILAYLLNPLVVVLESRTALKRGQAILVVYFGLAIAIIGSLVAVGFAAVDQSQTLLTEVPKLISQSTAVVQNSLNNLRPISFAGFDFDPTMLNWDTIQQQITSLVEPIIGRGGQMVTNLATATVRVLGNTFFIFIISIYIAIELPYLNSHVSSIATAPGYRKDAERIMREFGRIWNAYLRGQVILALSIFFIVWIGLVLLGVQNALALGILAGLLEFIPVVGPIISAVAVVIVAFFQPDTIFALASWQYALVVLGFMFLVQQVENSILVPRIVGEALDLNPIVVMIAVLMGNSIAGILGMILAAPVTASLKLVGTYAWRKLFDKPPFPEPEQPLPPSPAANLIQMGKEIVSDLTGPTEKPDKKELPAKPKRENPKAKGS